MGPEFYGLSQDSYLYCGYITVHQEFPAQIVGVRKAVPTMALVCPDPRWMNGDTIIVGTNFSLFWIQAHYWKQWEEKDLTSLRMHLLCATTY